MSKKSKSEFKKLTINIINNDKFKELDNELHHGITRFGHSYRVAKWTYKVCKLLHWNYQSATKAALLHDFYVDDDFKGIKPSKILAIHPDMALKNAKKAFEINELESNIIKSHMFPLSKNLPKYKESWIVSLIDKGVAIYEMYRYKFSLVINIWVIFLFNFITLNNS